MRKIGIDIFKSKEKHSRVNETKNRFLEKINKIDKLLGRLTRKTEWLFKLFKLEMKVEI